MKIIAYYRVSTKRQGESGLGLEGQREAVERYAASTGALIVTAYTEVETGKKPSRPQLAKAIAHAKRTGSTLVVAKLDRLARNLAFTSTLMESGVEFIACDNPHANRLTIHILAAVAEDEARRISERTKSALAAAKRRGAKLGASNPKCRNLTNDGRRRGSVAGGQAAKQAADEAYADMRDFFAAMRPSFSYQQIADCLNQRGDRTRTGKPWSDVAVMRACRRLRL